MPEVIFPGPEGRLEGRYHPQKDRAVSYTHLTLPTKLAV